jgi:hypothetical protein
LRLFVFAFHSGNKNAPDWWSEAFASISVGDER